MRHVGIGLVKRQVLPARGRGGRAFAGFAARSLALAFVTLQACDRAPADVMIATTTSVEDTGLLEALAAEMREDVPDVRVHMTGVGSGQALALARRGDADLVIVHDPAAESAFVAQGHGDRRRTIMRNDFVVIGPVADPAGVRAATDAADALRRIQGHLFLSRGDSSGTHRKELALWRRAGVEPRGEWYREAGIGQADVIRMAGERGAYALVDRGSFRFLEDGVAAVVLFEDPTQLDNPYSVIVATRAKNPDGARAVADWLAGARARALIDGFGRERYGEPLFQVVP
jgi:tungstate transport system substrate-binding protein